MVVYLSSAALWRRNMLHDLAYWQHLDDTSGQDYTLESLRSRLAQLKRSDLDRVIESIAEERRPAFKESCERHFGGEALTCEYSRSIPDF